MSDTNLESNEQSIQEPQPEPQSEPELRPIPELAIPPESIKQLKTVRTLGIICLVLGIITIMGWVACIALTFLVNPLFHWFILFLVWPFAIICFICVVLLIVCIVIKAKHHLPAKPALMKPILGTVLAFSFWVFIFMMPLIASIQQNGSTNGSSIVSKSLFRTCESSAKRASDNYYTVYKPEIGVNYFVVSKDAICSYLEYTYDYNAEPTSVSQLEPYMQSYVIKNNLVTIAISSDYPTSRNTYNIIPRRACSADGARDDSSISIWYRDEKHENGFGCVEFKSYDYPDMYDTQASHIWYETMFGSN